MRDDMPKKVVVAASMECPGYFTLPLQQRLELMQQLDRQPVFSTRRQDFLGWVKTGILSSSG
jgi:hypothetical protein